MTVLAQSMESLRPDGAPPAWAEIIGPLARPDQARWHDDLDTMMGFVAPADCAAIVTVGSGWARNLNEAPTDSDTVLGPGERRRCRVVFLLTRSGDVAGYLRSGPAILIGEAPTVGRIPDLVRRCLDLPTPPPEESTAGLLAVMWLAHIAGAGARSAGRLTWQAVAALHPALQVAAAAGIAVPPEQAVAALRGAADAWSWSHLARQAAQPGWLADLLPAGAAGWMDEGILCRWLLDSLPSIASLLDQVTPLLTAATAMKLRVTLGQLGVTTR